MKLALALLFLITINCTSYSQEKSRKGLRLGYTNDLLGLALNSENKNHYQQVSFGIEKTFKYLSYPHFVVGLDFIISNVTITGFDADLPWESPRPEVNDKYYVINLHTGKKTYFSKSKIFTYFGLLFEYDFSPAKDSRHLRQNGIGVFLSLGIDLNLSNNYVLSIMPLTQLHGFFLFKKGFEQNDNEPITGQLDWSLKFAFSKKEY